MRKFSLTLFGLLALQLIALSQTDTVSALALPSVFEKIISSVSQYKLDTSNLPDDKITRKILEVRRLRGGFNINEAIAFKLEEERRKGEMNPEEWKKLSDYFMKGDGKRWLDNAVSWIYRQSFTYRELKGLVKFYKSDAGQKMSEAFPLIMMQSLAAAEQIKETFYTPSKPGESTTPLR
ncbi:MAG: DUF2059 domain-containing protein [Chitinophagaceae bacterium]|nr:DUF2059 domain-containing protein [Chitinophagaceae bacterium]